MSVRSASETSESAKRVGSCRGGPGRCRLWRALVRAGARRSRPASLLNRRSAPRLGGHALAVTAPHEPAYQLSRPQYRRFGPIAICRMARDAMPRRGWTPAAARRINGRRLERNRKFVDSPLEEDGFELAVPPRRERLWGATPGKHCRLGPEPVSGSAFRAAVSDWQRPEEPFAGAEPMVRIRFPQALNPLRTSFSGGKRGKVRGDDKGRSRR